MSNQVPESLVRFDDVRLSFPHLAAPRPARQMSDGSMSKPKFEASLLMLPGSPQYAAFQARVVKLLQDQHKEHWQGALQKYLSDRKTRCFGNGEEVVDGKTFQVLNGYAGMVYVNAKSDRQPDLYGADGNRLMDASALYGGCRVNAYIQPWLQRNDGGGIRAEIIAVQFLRDDEPFGAAPIDTSTLFQPVAGAPAPVAPAAGFGAPAFGAPPAPGFGAPPAPAAPAFGAPPAAGPNW